MFTIDVLDHFEWPKHIFRMHTMLTHTENTQIHGVCTCVKSCTSVTLHLPPSIPQYTSTKLQILQLLWFLNYNYFWIVILCYCRILFYVFKIVSHDFWTVISDVLLEGAIVVFSLDLSVTCSICLDSENKKKFNKSLNLCLIKVLLCM